jgi:hypothetical protein
MVGVSCGEIPTTYGKLINEGHLKYISLVQWKCHNIVAKLELKGNLYMLFSKSCKLCHNIWKVEDKFRAIKISLVQCKCCNMWKVGNDGFLNGMCFRVMERK